jgi:polyisoprenoid-binding protein YceI
VPAGAHAPRAWAIEGGSGMTETTVTGARAGSETAGVWRADPHHTEVGFSAKHLGMMTVRGHFTDVSITGHIDPAHPEATAIEVTVRSESIQTNNEQRDKDIRASSFLDVAQFPTFTFKSTAIEPRGGDRYDMTGDLTIKGVTRPITLHGTLLGEFNDPRMGHRFGYSGEGTIKRKDFGMSFNPMLDGKLVVSDEIQLSIEGEIVEKPPEA